MKKLNKLQINTEKLMKNEELINLRGGYDGGGCTTTNCNGDSDCDAGCPKCRWPADPHLPKSCYAA